MALSLTIKHLFFAFALLYITPSCCQAQGTGSGAGAGGAGGAGAGAASGAAGGGGGVVGSDAVQIISRAALCLDNRPVMNPCLTFLGINTSSNGPISTTVVTKNINAGTAGFCNGPCFGEMMLMLNCMDGIFSNFQFYSPGLMQGMISIFQMSCRGSIAPAPAPAPAPINASLTKRDESTKPGGAGNLASTPSHGNELPRMPLWVLVLLASVWIL